MQGMFITFFADGYMHVRNLGKKYFKKTTCRKCRSGRSQPGSGGWLADTACRAEKPRPLCIPCMAVPVLVFRVVCEHESKLHLDMKTEPKIVARASVYTVMLTVWHTPSDEFC